MRLDKIKVDENEMGPTGCNSPEEKLYFQDAKKPGSPKVFGDYENLNNF